MPSKLDGLSTRDIALGPAVQSSIILSFTIQEPALTLKQVVATYLKADLQRFLRVFKVVRESAPQEPYEDQLNTRLSDLYHRKLYPK